MLKTTEVKFGFRLRKSKQTEPTADCSRFYTVLHLHHKVTENTIPCILATLAQCTEDHSPSSSFNTEYSLELASLSG